MPPKKKAANGYKLPDPLPLGEILQDVAKKQWVLGPSIGQGGFGEIYSAKEAGSTAAKYPFVIKIEPHENGPLFVEMHFYMRNAKQTDIDAFKKEKGLQTFGMPVYLGSGSHEHNSQKFRFIVMEKFGSDVWKLFLENKRKFPEVTVYKLAVQILDVLEYIHSQGYVHADIKGANILMGITKETEGHQVYLVDFGLGTKFTTALEYKVNPKKAHDGTLEYLSRDAHNGVPTRRGDLEILAYNIIQWLGYTLPWEKLKEPKAVQTSKEEHMKTAEKLLKACFGKDPIPNQLKQYVDYLLTLKFNTEPDYKKLRKILEAAVKASGGTLNTPFNFGKQPTKKRLSLPVKRKSSVNLPALAAKKPRAVKKTKSKTETTPKSPKKKSVTTKKPVDNATDTAGYTAAMLEVHQKAASNVTLRKKRLKEAAPSTSTDATNGSSGDMNGFTDAMKEVMLKKLAKETKKPKKVVPKKEEKEKDSVKPTTKRKR